MINSPRRKNLSPGSLKILPDLLKPKTPASGRMGKSKSGRGLIDFHLGKNKTNLQVKSLSSKDSLFSGISDAFEMKLSEDFKKVSNFYVDSSLNKEFFKEFVYEEPPVSALTDRKDARMLMEWLDFTLQKVQTERFENPKQLFDVANEIYSVCFVEIIRQVAMHCKERGYILSRVWKAYQTIFERALKISQSKYFNLQETVNSESFKIQVYLNERIAALEDQLSQTETEKQDLVTEIESQNIMLKSKTEKENRMMTNFGILQAQYKIAKRELLTLKEDTRILKVKFENIGAEDEFNNVVKRLIIPKRFKKKTESELEKELSRDPLVNDLFSDSESEIFEKISKYEKSIEMLFNQDDFIDKETETDTKGISETEVQTEVQDLCGETVGVKKRQSKLMYSTSITANNVKPMYFPEFRPYNQRTLTLETSKLVSDPYCQELKRKHVKLRRMLSTFKNSINSELGFEDMPHLHVLSGLLKNLTQASQIIRNHPLEALPITAEEIEEENEFKKKKMIQAVIAADDDKKKYKESDASNTLRRVSHTPVHKLKNVMFKKMLLKLILFFYEERVKEKGSSENFCDYVFNSLMKKYIMKKAAESKYHHLLASCVKYKSITRVRVFGRFLGLYDSFDTDDLNFYIECLNFLQCSYAGSVTSFSENLENIWVPYSRCVESIKFFERQLPKNEIPVLKLKLEKMKREDKNNKLGVVDLDEFLEHLVETYNEHNNSTKHFMQCIYGAADLNDDGYLQYKEFELLMRFLSNYIFNEAIIKKLFEEYAENFLSEEDDEVKAISLENLCQMNYSHKVFHANAVKNFTKVKNGEEALARLEIIEKRAEDLLSDLHWRFSETQVWEEHLDELKNLLDILKEKIYSKRSPEKTYLAYCLLNAESKRLIIEERIKELMPNMAGGFLNS